MLNQSIMRGSLYSEPDGSEKIIRTDDTSTAGATYIGEALTTSTGINPSTTEYVWRIRKQTGTGNSIVILWAEGNANYDKRWSDRTSLDYT